VRKAAAALVLIVLAAGCGGSRADTVDLRGTVPRLAELLRAHGVRPARPRTLAAAWLGFVDFSNVEIGDPQVAHELYLFEFGVYDQLLRVSLVRQLELDSGSIQQVHLELRYPLALSTPLRDALGVEKCHGGRGCVWSCALGADDLSMLLGTPCRLDAPTPRPAALLSASTWSNGGADAWRARVTRSTPFRFLRSRRPLGYRVWRDSPD
jgi:hypothetical protein